MTPYDDLKARAQKALDNDDWGTLKALFVTAQAASSAPAQSLGFSSAQADDSGGNGPGPHH